MWTPSPRGSSSWFKDLGTENICLRRHDGMGTGEALSSPAAPCSGELVQEISWAGPATSLVPRFFSFTWLQVASVLRVLKCHNEGWPLSKLEQLFHHCFCSPSRWWAHPSSSVHPQPHLIFQPMPECQIPSTDTWLGFYDGAPLLRVCFYVFSVSKVHD